MAVNSFGKSSMAMTPQLQQALTEKIKSLEIENKFFADFFDSIGSEDSAGSLIESPDGQTGVSIPRWYGLLNTFVTNPSNVSIGIIDRMIKTDDTVLCAVHFKATMMLSKIGEYQHDDNKIEDFVRDFLGKIKRPNWKQSLQGQASKVGYGFSTSEFMMGLNKKNQKVPMKVKSYHPSTMCFEVDPWGEVTEWGIVQFIIQSAQISNPNNYFPYFQYGFKVENPFETPNDRLLPYRMAFINNYGLVRIWKHKVIHHIENDMLSFGSPYGNTGVRTAHLAWQMKVFVMKQLGIATKSNALPFLHAAAPMKNNQVKVQDPRTKAFTDFNPIEAMKDLLRKRQSNDSIVTGSEEDGYKITSIMNQCDLEQIIDVLKFLNTMIFRSFVIPSLVVTDGEGSRSLGEKQFEIVDQMASEDAENFADNIVDQMIKRTIIENFGEQDNYGEFAKKPLSLAERKELSDMFCNLANAGWMSPLDKSQGDHVASVLDIPERDDDFYLNPNANGAGEPVIEDPNNPGKETPPNV
jgi:hypothetical protein